MSTIGVNKKSRLKEQSQQLEEKKARIDREIYLIEKKEELSNLIFNTLKDGSDVHLCRNSHWIDHDGITYKINFSINYASDEMEGSESGKKKRRRFGANVKKKSIQKNVPKRVAKALCAILVDHPPMRRRDIINATSDVKGFDPETMYTDFKTIYLEREGKNQGAGTLFKVKK